MRDYDRQICVGTRQNWRGVIQQAESLRLWESNAEAVAAVDVEAYECFAYHPRPYHDPTRQTEATVYMRRGRIYRRYTSPRLRTSPPPDPKPRPAPPPVPLKPKCKGHPLYNWGCEKSAVPDGNGYCGIHRNVLRRTFSAKERVLEAVEYFKTIRIYDALERMDPMGYFPDSCAWCGKRAPYWLSEYGVSLTACVLHAYAARRAGFVVKNNFYGTEAKLPEV